MNDDRVPVRMGCRGFNGGAARAGALVRSVFTQVLVVVAAFQMGTPAGAASWQMITPQNAPPPARQDAAMVYDRARERVIVFGGRGVAGEFDDTWSFHLPSRTWQALATGSAVRPSPRFSVVAGIDDGEQRLIIATGQGVGGIFFNDAWSFDLQSNTWTQLTPSGTKPNVRYGSAGGTFDPGGFLPGGGFLYLTHGFTSSGRFDDTWSLDGLSPAWSSRVAVGPRPLRRCLHGGAMVSATELVIFGGCASGSGPCPIGDTWRFDNATGAWTDLTQAVRPPARLFPSLARMGDGRDVLLFGGYSTANTNDVWKLDASTGAWTQLVASGTPPSPRQSASLVWVDSPDRSLTGSGCGFGLAFGGASDTGNHNDLWMLLPSSPPSPPAVAAGLDPAGVRISWAADPDIVRYEVWRSDEPQFAATGPGLTRLPGEVAVQGASASYVDQGPPASARILFYQVRLAACAF